MGAENLDPLGLGRIDTRQLSLVRPAVVLLSWHDPACNLFLDLRTEIQPQTLEGSPVIKMRLTPVITAS